MTDQYPADHRRFMPPAMRAALGEPEPETSAIPEDPVPQGDVVRSRAYRFFHAPAWKYAIGGLSLLVILVLFGMMCSPAYWRF